MSVEDTLNRTIIVTGLPPNASEKNKAALETFFNKALHHSNYALELCHDGSVCIGAFLSFTTTDFAKEALETLNGKALSKFIIKTYQWTELERARETAATAAEAAAAGAAAEGEVSPEEPLVNNVAEDDRGRAQFLVKGGLKKSCEWFWFDWEKQQPELYRNAKLTVTDPVRRWSDLDREAKALQRGMIASLAPIQQALPIFSTYGNLVISQSAKGLSVWGGRAMNLLYEIEEVVSAFMVSPSERYIVIKTEKDVRVYNMYTAERIRVISNMSLQAEEEWPPTRFSADDSLLAVVHTGGYRKAEERQDDRGRYTVAEKIENGEICVYQTATMNPVVFESSSSAAAPTSAAAAARGQNLVKAGLRKLDWNPVKGTQMAYCSYLGITVGWRVDISTIEVSESTAEGVLQGREVPQTFRNFVHAEGVDMLWHPTGTHLAMKVTIQANKRVEYYLADVTKPQVAISQLTVKPRHFPYRFAWMPNGSAFALILINEDIGVGTRGDNFTLQIFSMSGKTPKLLEEFATAATSLFWSPLGGRLVTVNFDFSKVQFFTLTKKGNAEGVRKENTATTTHLTNCQWDPSGRFFATWVSSLAEKKGMSPQYAIFDFKGNLLYQRELDPLSHFIWRPLPPSTLSDEELRALAASADTLYDDHRQAREESANAKLQQEKQERKAQEDRYRGIMENLARRMREQQLDTKREELRRQSRWVRYWAAQINGLSEEDRTVRETVIKERIISRRQVGK